MRGLELERLLVQAGVGVVARVLPGRDVREVLVVAQRLAILGLVLDPEVAAAALLAVQGVADSSSPNSRKSATRPAFSSDWLSDSPSPSTRTFLWNSSRRAGISASAFSRLASLRSMPQLSHSTLPSSRWK